MKHYIQLPAAKKQNQFFSSPSQLSTINLEENSLKLNNQVIWQKQHEYKTSKLHLHDVKKKHSSKSHLQQL